MKPTVLQPSPRSTVTSANATQSVALRTYLAWGLRLPPPGPANDLPSTQRQGDWSGCPIHRGLSAWDLSRLPYMSRDLRRDEPASDREIPLIAEDNGPLTP